MPNNITLDELTSLANLSLYNAMHGYNEYNAFHNWQRNGTTATTYASETTTSSNSNTNTSSKNQESKKTTTKSKKSEKKSSKKTKEDVKNATTNASQSLQLGLTSSAANDANVNTSSTANLSTYKPLVENSENKNVLVLSYQLHDYIREGVLNNSSKISDEDSDIPTWGVADFQNDRVNWQKSLTSLAGEPGFYYFKVFFKFNTSYGLFGGVFDNTVAINSAISYMLNVVENHRSLKIEDRVRALYRFTHLLSFISSSAPWFFNSIKGLDDASNVYMKDITKEKSILIECLPDAIDMRLLTLFELYKYACYDMNTFREIVPSNLRKFDMTVLVMNVPIKYHQTGFSYVGLKKTSSNNVYNNKTTNAANLADAISYKAFIFKNCEFDVDSMKSIYGDMKNDNPQMLSLPTIKITYQRCYQLLMNEFEGMMFGYRGFKYDVLQVKFSDALRSFFENYSDVLSNYGFATKGDEGELTQRLSDIGKGRKSKFYSNYSTSLYRALVETSESILNDAMNNVNSTYSLGNLYSGDSLFIDTQNTSNSLYDIGSQIKGMLDFPNKIVDNYKSNLKKLEASIDTFKSKYTAKKFMAGYNGSRFQDDTESTEDFLNGYQNTYASYQLKYGYKNLSEVSDEAFLTLYAEQVEALREKLASQQAYKSKVVTTNYATPTDKNLYDETDGITYYNTNGVQIDKVLRFEGYKAPQDSNLYYDDKSYYRATDGTTTTIVGATKNSSNEYPKPKDSSLYYDDKTYYRATDGTTTTIVGATKNSSNEYPKPLDSNLYYDNLTYYNTTNGSTTNIPLKRKIINSKYPKPYDNNIYDDSDTYYNTQGVTIDKVTTVKGYKKPTDTSLYYDGTSYYNGGTSVESSTASMTKAERLKAIYKNMWDKHELGNLYK